MSVFGWGFSFLVPILFMALIELSFIPGVVSLIVGFDVALLLVEMVVFASLS